MSASVQDAINTLSSLIGDVDDPEQLLPTLVFMLQRKIGSKTVAAVPDVDAVLFRQTVAMVAKWLEEAHDTNAQDRVLECVVYLLRKTVMEFQPMTAERHTFRELENRNSERMKAEVRRIRTSHQYAFAVK
jgi:hypothetical protein